MIGSELPKLKTTFYESHFHHCVVYRYCKLSQSFWIRCYSVLSPNYFVHFATFSWYAEPKLNIFFQDRHTCLTWRGGNFERNSSPPQVFSLATAKRNEWWEWEDIEFIFPQKLSIPSNITIQIHFVPFVLFWGRLEYQWRSKISALLLK